MNSCSALRVLAPWLVAYGQALSNIPDGPVSAGIEASQFFPLHRYRDPKSRRRPCRPCTRRCRSTAVPQVVDEDPPFPVQWLFTTNRSGSSLDMCATTAFDNSLTKSHSKSGSIGTTTCRPLPPLVLRKGSNLGARACHAPAARPVEFLASSRPHPGLYRTPCDPARCTWCPEHFGLGTRSRSIAPWRAVLPLCQSTASEGDRAGFRSGTASSLANAHIRHASGRKAHHHLLPEPEHGT